MNLTKWSRAACFVYGGRYGLSEANGESDGALLLAFELASLLVQLLAVEASRYSSLCNLSR